jgi:hypothetical protein
MTTDQAARLHLYEQARAVLDEAAADTLMNALPRDLERFATKDDLAVLSHELRTEISARHNDLLARSSWGWSPRTPPSSRWSSPPSVSADPASIG